MVLVFFTFQLLIPWRYFMYPGELFWTEEGYRFSWRVMLMEKAGSANFKIVDEKVFADEKDKLLGYLQQTLTLGEKEFEGKDSKSFGPLTAKEWDNMFYKHLDHHLNQFGV